MNPKKPAPAKKAPAKKAEPKVSYEEVFGVVKEMLGPKQENKDSVVEFLSEFNVSTAKDLKEDQYAAFVKRGKELLEAATTEATEEEDFA